MRTGLNPGIVSSFLLRFRSCLRLRSCEELFLGCAAAVSRSEDRRRIVLGQALFKWLCGKMTAWLTSWSQNSPDAKARLGTISTREIIVFCIFVNLWKTVRSGWTVVHTSLIVFVIVGPRFFRLGSSDPNSPIVIVIIIAISFLAVRTSKTRGPPAHSWVPPTNPRKTPKIPQDLALKRYIFDDPSICAINRWVEGSYAVNVFWKVGLLLDLDVISVIWTKNAILSTKNIKHERFNTKWWNFVFFEKH